MISFLSCQRWHDYNLNIRPDQQGHGGGMGVKTQRVTQALGRRYYVDTISDTDDISAPIVIVEPLWFRTFVDWEKEPKKDWERLNALKVHKNEHGRKLILTCSEWEVMRWTPDFREAIVDTFDMITSSCEYQMRLFDYFDLTPQLLCDPVSAHLFAPAETKPEEHMVVAINQVSWFKNSQAIVDIYAALQERGIRTSHIGSASLWSKAYVKQNLSIQKDLEKVTDVFHKSIAEFEIATAMRQSTIGLWVATHETFGTGYAEMMSTGLPVVTGEHGLADDRPSCRTGTIVESIERLVVDDDYWQDRSEAMRTWIEENVSFDVYLDQFSAVLKAVY